MDKIEFLKQIWCNRKFYAEEKSRVDLVFLLRVRNIATCLPILVLLAGIMGFLIQ